MASYAAKGGVSILIDVLFSIKCFSFCFPFSRASSASFSLNDAFNTRLKWQADSRTQFRDGYLTYKEANLWLKFRIFPL